MVNLRPGIPIAASSDDLGVKKRLKFIKESMGSIEDCNANILDIGCGYGIYLSTLEDFSQITCGVEINLGYLSKAKVNSKNSEFALMSAEELGFKEKYFDLILMIEVLEHINDDEKALREAFKALKPGCALIVTVPNRLFPFETHAIRIGSKLIGLPMGIPFLPWLPIRIRRFLVTARVYTLGGISEKLYGVGFKRIDFRFLAPTLDRGGNNEFVKFVRAFFNSLEKLSIRAGQSTIILMAVK